MSIIIDVVVAGIHGFSSSAHCVELVYEVRSALAEIYPVSERARKRVIETERERQRERESIAGSIAVFSPLILSTLLGTGLCAGQI